MTGRRDMKADIAQLAVERRQHFPATAALSGRQIGLCVYLATVRGLLASPEKKVLPEERTAFERTLFNKLKPAIPDRCSDVGERAKRDIRGEGHASHHVRITNPDHKPTPRPEHPEEFGANPVQLGYEVDGVDRDRGVYTALSR